MTKLEKQLWHTPWCEAFSFFVLDGTSSDGRNLSVSQTVEACLSTVSLPSFIRFHLNNSLLSKSILYYLDTCQYYLTKPSSLTSLLILNCDFILKYISPINTHNRFDWIDLLSRTNMTALRGFIISMQHATLCSCTTRIESHG